MIIIAMTNYHQIHFLNAIVCEKVILPDFPALKDGLNRGPVS